MRVVDIIKQPFWWNIEFLVSEIYPEINKNAYHLGRHGSPWADTQSARSYGDYHAFWHIPGPILANILLILGQNLDNLDLWGLGS